MLQGPSIIPNNISSAVILCHGYGSNGDDMFGLALQLQNTFPNTAFYCPNGITQIDSDAYEWFSLHDFVSPDAVTPAYIEELIQRSKPATEQLNTYIQEIKKIHHLQDKHLFIGGFSQGGLIALHTGLKWPNALGGLISCSGIPIGFHSACPPSCVHHQTPVLLTHGEMDPVVPVQSLFYTQSELAKINITPDIFIGEYLMHTIDMDCIRHISAFIQEHLKNG